MASDWLTAVREIVMLNEWRHNVRYDFLNLRYDVITWTKKTCFGLWRHNNDDDINFRRSGNVKQHKWLPQICPTTGNFCILLNKKKYETIIKFGFRMIWRIIKPSVCLYQPQPSASVDNEKFWIDNSSYHSQFFSQFVNSRELTHSHAHCLRWK
jgi:hypothetical protein